MTKEEDKTYDNIEDFIRDLEKHKDTWLDRRFPKGICGRRASYTITHPWLLIGEMWDEVIWAWQRIFRGWDNRIVWSIDMHLAKMIPEWLELLKERSTGISISMYEPDDFDENYDPIDGADERAIAKYNKILDDIILGFKCYDEGDGLWDAKEPNYEFMKANFDNAFKLLHEHFSLLYD